MNPYRRRTHWQVAVAFGTLALFTGLCVIGYRWATKIEPIHVASCSASYGHGWHLRITDTTGGQHWLDANDLAWPPQNCHCDVAARVCYAPGTVISKERWTLDHRIDGEVKAWPRILDGPLTSLFGVIFILVGLAFRWHERRLMTSARSAKAD